MWNKVLWDTWKHHHQGKYLALNDELWSHWSFAIGQTECIKVGISPKSHKGRPQNVLQELQAIKNSLESPFCSMKHIMLLPFLSCQEIERRTCVLLLWDTKVLLHHMPKLQDRGRFIRRRGKLSNNANFYHSKDSKK